MQDQQLLLQILENTKQIQETLTKHSIKFEQIDKRFDQIDKKFEEYDRKFEEYDKRFDRIDKKFEEYDRKFEGYDESFKALTQDITFIKDKLQSLENIVTRMESLHEEKLQVLFDFFVDTNKKFNRYKRNIQKIFAKLDRYHIRLYRLEFYKDQFLSK